MFDLSLKGKGKISNLPFWHYVEDNFLPEELATKLYLEFPPYKDQNLQSYDNPLECKRIQSHWFEFKPLTYKFINFLNSKEFIDFISSKTGINDLKADSGLHGAGQFMHTKGGRLNPHQDYSIHPKLGLERRLSLLIYLTPKWQKNWYGDLVLYEKKEKLCEVKRISPLFNRLVIFQTTSSWHGIPEFINCPAGVCRNAIGIFYLTEPRKNHLKHKKALYCTYGDQEGNAEIEELIKQRSSEKTAKSVYL